MKQEKQIHIADTNHGTILLSNLEKEVISTKLFNRLHHILQNSTLYLTFPSNKTKRFEHSIGTMKLCGDMFYNAVCNTSEKDLEGMFKKISDFISEEIVDKILLETNQAHFTSYKSFLGDGYYTQQGAALKELEKINISSVFYNRYMPVNIKDTKEEIIYLVTFQAIRLCGLLHDIGHPPFSHVVEKSMKSIYEELKEKESLTVREKEYLEIIKNTIDDNQKFQLHESMGNIMVERLSGDFLFSPNSIFKNIRNPEERYFITLVFKLVGKIFNDKSLKFLHNIISGPIDGDRLDYVIRDITNSGLNGGKIEYDRLLSSCKFITSEEPDEYALGFYIKTINTIDDFFLKRWFLYKNIIYHHRVVKTDALMRICLKDIINIYLLSDDEDKKDDNLLPNDISGLWRAIKFSYINENYFNYLIQWDDNWLLTTLKKYYFEKYYNKECKGKDIFTSYKLEELLSNKKNYYSLIKNYYDFCIFNDVFEKAIDLSPLKKKNDSNQKDSDYNKWKAINKKFSRYNENILMYKLHAYFDTFNEGNFNFIMEKLAEAFVCNEYKGLIDDHIFVMQEINTGLSEEPLVYASDDISESYKLSEFSNVKKTLELEKFYYPYFYIYIKFSENSNKSIKNIKNDFLKKFAQYAATEINDRLSK